ncbi:MAG: alpha/beta hydrolase [Lachnospiraceae bacterium]|nr:alpha/beta hydrolase [Lachnospiraceae bacterium]
MKNAKRVLCIGLLLILIGSIGAALLQTDFGQVKIRDINLITEDHQHLHGLMFIPKTATAENPAPVVITSHGWLNSAEVQDAASIELSRRGIVVIAMDAYNHGLSSSVQVDQLVDSDLYGQGMVPLVEYVHSDVMNFIDKNRVGVMGHSMGGRASKNTAIHYSRLYNAAIEEAMQPDSDGGEEITEAEQAYADSQMKIASALPTGQSPGSLADWSEIRCNMGFLYGLLEEGGYGSTTGTADLRGASKEALDMVNSGDPSVTSVEEGVFYGDKEAGTLRVLYQPYITHPLIHFDPASTADVVEWFTYTLDVPTFLEPTDQVFLIKEGFNFIAMIGLFMLLVPIGALLLSVPCFASLRGTPAPALPAPDAEGKKKFWRGWWLGGLVSFLAAWAATVIVPSLGNPMHGFSMANWFLFAAPTMNTVAFWTILSTIWAVFWFFYNYSKDKAAGIRDENSLGLKISAGGFFKSIAFAATVIGIIYCIVWFCKWAFNTDFRFWTPAVKTFDVGHLFYFFQYLPFFFAFYLMNSLMVNSASRFETKSEKGQLFILGLGNILGIIILWALQYGKLLATGTVIWGPGWINVLVIAFCFWQLFLAPFFLRAFYKLTGRNWVGPLVVSSIYVLCGIMNTAVHSTIL